ncbi:L-psp endoribonuclease family protein [Xylariomycetidae sp. FL0641]|nr:L-psp endoribonuclease family protein [Xylariomycetidae sp. FL0641]
MASAKKELVLTDKAPAPIPQLSQAVKYNGMVYCSGNIGMSPATKEFAPGGVGPETTQAMTNLKAVLEAAGSSWDNVVKVNIFLTNMDDFATMNEAYTAMLKDVAIKPCRTCVAAYQLPRGAKMEIECTAFLNSNAKL